MAVSATVQDCGSRREGPELLEEEGGLELLEEEEGLELLDVEDEEELLLGEE
jgi:hypothetical protein